MRAGGVCACVVVAERGDGVDRGTPQGTGGTDRRDAAGGGPRGRPGTGVFHPVVVSARGETGGEAGPAGDRRGPPCRGEDVQGCGGGLSRGEGAGTDGHALPIDTPRIHGPLRRAAAVVALQSLYRRGPFVALRLYVGEGGQRGLAGGAVVGATWSRWRLLAAGDERAPGREAEYRAALRHGAALCAGEEGHRLCD